MQKINKQLNHNLKKYKLEDKLKAYQAINAWAKVVSEILPNAAEQTMALSLERGVLKIAALSREIIFEIKLYSKRIIQRLNEAIGKKLVFVIVFES